MSGRTLAVSGTLLFSLAAPAAAQAVPTMDPLEPCYVTALVDGEEKEQGFDVRATGFTPNSKVDLAIDGAVVEGGAGLQTDDSGTLGPLRPVPAPFIEDGTRDFTVSLTEQGNAANSVTATAKTSALGVTMTPENPESVTDKVRFKGLGFLARRPVYAHYLRKGRLRKTVRMTRTTGECGAWEAHRRQFPLRRVRRGRWSIRFDQYRKLVARPDVMARLDFRVDFEPR